MKKKNLDKLMVAVLVSLAAYTPNSYALVKLSRACSWETLGGSLDNESKIALLLLFKAISTMTVAEFSELLNKSPNFSPWWILESVTTDYLEERYYLYARTKSYAVRYDRAGTAYYYDYSDRESDGWRFDSLDPSLVASPAIARFMANRKWLYSSRAGHPSILEKITAPNEISGRFFSRYYVVGEHRYLDPANNVPGYLGRTETDNCNLLQWGFEP